MKPLLNRLSMNATNMIRMDHTHVLGIFHRYKPDTPPERKKGLVNMACTALEVHAELEEEIFYPAVRAISENEVVKKSVPEHDEMRRLIARLRAMEPTDPGYDDTFMELMRDVLHHVADEETVMLPEAERVIPERLDELGASMTRRRMELMKPRMPEVATNLARAVPRGTWAVSAVALAGAVLIGRHLVRSR